jgi:hypothetical protein
VFTGFERTLNLLEMKVRRRAEIDNINVRPGKDGLEIGNRLGNLAFGSQLGCAFGIDIADSNDVEKIRSSLKSFYVVGTNPGPDDNDTKKRFHSKKRVNGKRQGGIRACWSKDHI